MGRNESHFECDNPECDSEMDWDVSKGHVPLRWNFISVLGKRMLMCDACKIHFDRQAGADNGLEEISPMMKRDLGIDNI